MAYSPPQKNEDSDWNIKFLSPKNRRGCHKDLSGLHHGHCFWGGKRGERKVMVDSVNASFLGLKWSEWWYSRLIFRVEIHQPQDFFQDGEPPTYRFGHDSWFFSCKSQLENQKQPKFAPSDVATHPFPPIEFQFVHSHPVILPSIHQTQWPP